MTSVRKLIAAVGLAVISQMALASPVVFSGALSIADPTFNRTLSGNPPTSLSGVGTSVSYDVYQFHVTASGSYLLRTLSAAFLSGASDDTFLSLYQNAFSAQTPLVNAIQSDDDSGDGGLSTITRALNTDTNYFLVVTSFDNGQFGNYSGLMDTVTGAGQVVLGAVPTEIPEPASIALVGLALAGLGMFRRRNG